ncbi:MAG: nickel-dependent hydrogenase large subunit [Methanomassiliicoccales archaeon]
MPSTIIPFGPQHPTFLEPLNLRLRIEEERVVGADINIGYNHRGMEYALAQDFRRSFFLSERVCGICSFHHGVCYAQAMEDVYKIEVPLRAKLVRTIFMECQRLTSHLLAVGHIAETMGYEALFMKLFKEREQVMQLVNRVTGNRVHYSLNTVGGLRKDITYEQAKDVEDTITALEPQLLDIQKIVHTDRTFRKRLHGVGVLSKAMAETYCVVGPTARGSGLPHDIRLTGFAAYGVEGMKFEPCYYEEGDCHARTKVRIDECVQSADLIFQALELLRDGPFVNAVKTLPPSGEGWSRVEAPRGELFYHIRAQGAVSLDRVKIKTPAFVNIPAVAAMMGGAMVHDVAVIVVSVDPCICCTDR